MPGTGVIVGTPGGGFIPVLTSGYSRVRAGKTLGFKNKLQTHFSCTNQNLHVDTSLTERHGCLMVIIRDEKTFQKFGWFTKLWEKVWFRSN